MTNYYKSGSFGYAGGGKTGAIVDMWAVSRFGGVFPAQDAAPPSGSPDAGPVVTGSEEGNPGGYLIENIPEVVDYNVRFQYGGHSYWGGCPAGSIGGQGSGGGGGGGTPFIVNEVQYGPSTITTYTPTTALAAVDSTHLTVTFTVPAGGAVRITASLYAQALVNNTDAQLTLAFVEHGTTTLATPREDVLGTVFVASEEYIVNGRVTYDSGLITGLTPGGTLTWDLAAQLLANGTGTFVVDDGLTSTNNSGPALITVYNPAGTGGGGGGGGAVSSVSNVDGSLLISPTTGGVEASLVNPLPNALLGVENTTSSTLAQWDATSNPPSVLVNGVRQWWGHGPPTDATYGILSATNSAVGDIWYDAALKADYLCTTAGLPGTAVWTLSTLAGVFTAPQQIILGTGVGTSEIALLYNAAAYIPTNAQTTNYTAQATDVGKVIEMNNGSATTLTIPPSVFTTGQTFEVCQVGAGPVTIGAVSGTPSVTHVSDVESSGSPLSSLTIAPAAVGNAVLFSIRIGSTTVTGTPTGGGCTWTQIGSPVVGTDTAVTTQTWLGVCTTTGTSTVTVTWTGTIGTDFTVLGAHEFSSGLGAGTTWTLDGSAVTVNTTSTSTAVTFPSVTAAGSNELYYTEIYTTNTTPAGSSAGFTYYGGGSKDLAVWNLAATGTLAPTATQSSTGFYSGIGFCLIATNPTVTIDAPGGANVLNEQWSSATVRFRSGTECVLAGDLTT